MNKVLMGGLVASLAATLWVASGDDDATVEPVKSSGASSAPGRKAAMATASAARDPRRYAADMAQSLAAWQSRPPLAAKTPAQWQAWGPALPPPPPAKVVSSGPPPDPIAPRFPHAWVGRFNDQAVVSGTHSTWVLSPGQIVDGQWRVDQIQGRQMQVTYLPLKQAQTVAMQSP